jgi:hypothetical protein
MTLCCSGTFACSHTWYLIWNIVYDIVFDNVYDIVVHTISNFYIVIRCYLWYRRINLLISNSARYWTMNIRYQRKIIDIEVVKSISKVLLRHRAINIENEATTLLSKLQLRYWSYNFIYRSCSFHIEVLTLILKFLARYYQKLRLCAGVIMRAHRGTSAIPAGTVRFHGLSS